jgi:hypothetical protein
MDRDIIYLSEQYRIELLGVMICFSQTVLNMTLDFCQSCIP